MSMAVVLINRAHSGLAFSHAWWVMTFFITFFVTSFVMLGRKGHSDIYVALMSRRLR
jgi:hypothetical protein